MSPACRPAFSAADALVDARDQQAVAFSDPEFPAQFGGDLHDVDAQLPGAAELDDIVAHPGQGRFQFEHFGHFGQLFGQVRQVVLVELGSGAAGAVRQAWAPAAPEAFAQYHVQAQRLARPVDPDADLFAGLAELQRGGDIAKYGDRPAGDFLDAVAADDPGLGRRRSLVGFQHLVGIAVDRDPQPAGNQFFPVFQLGGDAPDLVDGNGIAEPAAGAFAAADHDGRRMVLEGEVGA